ncbi:hypothetical protein [Acinetobacter sp.]|uniref:hypothetical protein n=1 Tax=Acinetobacter sp. TaxID=472 RepID=UPI0028AD333D|nr:hypothetical protein [Acinetobacter sp.]
MTKIHPQLKQKMLEQQQDTPIEKASSTRPRPAQTQQVNTRPTKPTKSQAPVSRSRIPPLLGIEITASQQRRLGKNDPSVLAAQRAKQLNQTHHTDSTWFEQLTSQVEHVLQQPNNASKHQSTASRPQQKSAFNKMFEDLFSK